MWRLPMEVPSPMYDILLNHVRNHPNLFTLERLHTSWEIAVPNHLLKYEDNFTECIPTKYHPLCEHLQNVPPEHAVIDYLAAHKHKLHNDVAPLYGSAPILINHSTQTYVVLGEILEVLESGDNKFVEVLDD